MSDKLHFMNSSLSAAITHVSSYNISPWFFYVPTIPQSRRQHQKQLNQPTDSPPQLHRLFHRILVKSHKHNFKGSKQNQ
jgi:hypothetical protein